MRWFHRLLLISSLAVLPIWAEPRDTKVAILGSSQSADENSRGINKDVLARLLILAKEKKPSALFFMGDMALGVFKGEVGEKIPDTEDNYGFNWRNEGYIYDSQAYQRQLDEFTAIIAETLGKQIPVYPVLGFHESLGRDAGALAKRQFDIRSQIDPAASPLAYSVGIKNSCFIVFSTTSYDPIHGRVSQHDLNPSLLDWIDSTLKDNSGKYDYYFAIGYEPAFSTSAAEGKYRGLDSVSEQRDRLWHILAENKVSAYFSTSEHLYDRTNRGGIWQIISGGAGAPLHKREFDKAFYHFLLLSIPEKKGRLPKVQVYDVQGSLNDAFELVPRQYPVYQLRISDLAPEISEAKGEA